MSEFKLHQRYCPIHGEPLNFSGECTNRGCWYILKDENVIDISFKSQGIAKALSNLCNYNFEIDGIKCESIESFIQSLRTPNPKLQREICQKSGPFCYSIRTILPDWRRTHTVYWQGKPIDRYGEEYFNLLRDAYKRLYEDSYIFNYAVNISKGYTLRHSIGCHNITLTLLTTEEYISLLEELRQS